MPRKIGFWLAIGLAAAVLAWAAWPGTPDNPATLISRIDVIAAVIILAGLPWLIRRRFGPVGNAWLPRALRVAGYALVLALLLVKANVERFEFVRLAERPGFSGVWLGEAVFLVFLAAYVTGLLAVTSRRPPASPTSLAIGTGVGVVLGVTIYVVRPLEGPIHTHSSLLTGIYMVARVIAVPLVCLTGVAAGIAAARRTARRDRRRPRIDPRARAGVVAGLCAGAAAALLVSVLGIGTIALVPHLAHVFQWTLPIAHHRFGSAYAFEAGVTEAGAGYLLVLILFPLVGAGLGAWGGLYASDKPDHGSGGGGGWGRYEPRPGPKPPGGLRLGPQPDLSALDLSHLLTGPDQERLPSSPSSDPGLPHRRERTPVG